MRILPSEQMNNDGVLRSWRASRQAGAGALHTDGNRLYSNRLEIGFTDEGGYKILIDYTESGGDFRNRRVSHHVGMTKKYADRIISSPKRHEAKIEETIHANRKETISHIEHSIAPDQSTYFNTAHTFRRQAGVR